VPPSHTVPAGPKMMACHWKMSLPTGVPLMPSGGSVLSVRKSFFSRRLADDVAPFDDGAEDDDCRGRHERPHPRPSCSEVSPHRRHLLRLATKGASGMRARMNAFNAEKRRATNPPNAPSCAAWPFSCQTFSHLLATTTTTTARPLLAQPPQPLRLPGRYLQQQARRTAPRRPWLFKQTRPHATGTPTFTSCEGAQRSLCKIQVSTSTNCEPHHG
jgi:hypothetical protein